MQEYHLVYQLFPRSFGITEEIKAVVSCFEKNYDKIKSPDKNLSSDGVLKILAEDLKQLNFRVEGSKASIDKIKVPVLFSINNRIDKFFDADAVSENGKIVIEVEAGRGYRNNQFLKDIFQACMMPNAEYLVIAVRNHYYNSDDFNHVCRIAKKGKAVYFAGSNGRIGKLQY
jgi:hypothetical protein